MSNDNRTDKQKIGTIGEDTACRFLVKRGFRIIGRNYCKKWGEIDVIAKRGKILHFVEVKTVSRLLTEASAKAGEKVTRETGSNEAYRPEDNLHSWKLQRLERVINSYLLEKDISEDKVWQLDGVTVYLDLSKKRAKVEYLENLVL